MRGYEQVLRDPRRPKIHGFSLTFQAGSHIPLRINPLTSISTPFSHAASLAPRLQLGMALPSASSAARLWKSDENVQFKKLAQNCNDSTRRQHRTPAHGTSNGPEFIVQCPGADWNFYCCIDFRHYDHVRNRSTAAGNAVARRFLGTYEPHGPQKVGQSSAEPGKRSFE